MAQRKHRAGKAPEEEPRNASQLRDAIDSGRTRDKVAAEDPATAPLGTDEEASGQPLGARHFEALRTQRQTASPQMRWQWRHIMGAALVVLAAAAVLAFVLSL